MLGVVNKAIESFLRDTYGSAWDDIARAAKLDPPSFEALLAYDDALTAQVIVAAEARIGKSRDALLEDLGIYLISHPRYEALRRLLRFAGVTFEDFLLSVDELPDRARLALPCLAVPTLRISAAGPNRFELCCGPGWPGFAQVLAGSLRAMADDYGALVTLGHRSESRQGAACIDITLHEPNHSTGRSFELAAPGS